MGPREKDHQPPIAVWDSGLQRGQCDTAFETLQVRLNVKEGRSLCLVSRGRIEVGKELRIRKVERRVSVPGPVQNTSVPSIELISPG